MRLRSLLLLIALPAIGASATSWIGGCNEQDTTVDAGTWDASCGAVCGETAPGAGSTTLSESAPGILGPALIATNTIGFVGATMDGTPYAGFTITDIPGSCSLLRMGEAGFATPSVVNGQTFFALVELPGDGGVAPGTYEVPTVAGGYGSLTMTGGSLTLTSVSCTAITGSFQLTLQSFGSTVPDLRDVVTGTFTAPTCAFNPFGVTSGVCGQYGP